MRAYRMPYMGKVRKVRFHIASYQNTGNLAIEIMAKMGPFRWEPCDMMTVNLSKQFGPEFALIDTNHVGEEVLGWLIRKKLAIKTGWAEQSGFCMYPQVRFHKDFLKRADPEGYRELISYWEIKTDDNEGACVVVE